MADCPAISVVIAAYNAEQYIQVCVNSVQKQTINDIEIICVDDGSTDNTYDILKSISELDSRVKILYQDNKGAGAARNLGLINATGKYIIFLDADDFFDESMLKSMYDLAELDHLDMVICQAYEYDDKTKRTNRILDWAAQSKMFTSDIFSYKDNTDAIFQAINTWAWNKLLRRSLVVDNNIKFQELMSSNDNLFISTALVLAERISILNKPYIFYRVNNPNSLQRSKEKTWYCPFEAAYAVQEMLIDHGLYEDLQKSFINKSLKNVIYYYDTVKQGSIEQIKIGETIQTEFTEKLHLNDYPEQLFDPKLLNKYLWIKGKEYFDYDQAIPILMSCDESYAAEMYVTIKSILLTKNEETVLDFYIILHDDYRSKHKKKLQKLIKNYNNVKITFVNKSTVFDDLDLGIDHITLPTYYRLDMANVIPSSYDKCLYLDTDVIVKEDLSDLFSVDLSKYYAAGVKAASYIMNRSNLGYMKSIGIVDVEKYINAGVVLFNLKRIREENLTEMFLKLSKNNFTSLDQDVINVAFRGEILILPLRYNLQTKYESLTNQKCSEYSRIIKVYPKNELNEAVQNPAIIHYAGPNKPWNTKGVLHEKMWWDVANEVPYRLFEPLKDLSKRKIKNMYHAVKKFSTRPSKREILLILKEDMENISTRLEKIEKK